jgi:hypothetical protein
LSSNTKGYGGRTDWTDSQNSDTPALSGRELYHLQFLLQAASPETFWIHTRIRSFIIIIIIIIIIINITDLSNG